MNASLGSAAEFTEKALKFLVFGVSTVGAAAKSRSCPCRMLLLFPLLQWQRRNLHALSITACPCHSSCHWQCCWQCPNGSAAVVALYGDPNGAQRRASRGPNDGGRRSLLVVPAYNTSMSPHDLRLTGKLIAGVLSPHMHTSTAATVTVTLSSPLTTKAHRLEHAAWMRSRQLQHLRHLHLHLHLLMLPAPPGPCH